MGFAVGLGDRTCRISATRFGLGPLFHLTATLCGSGQGEDHQADDGEDNPRRDQLALHHFTTGGCTLIRPKTPSRRMFSRIFSAASAVMA